ncbi:3-deoxy-manno-octulosonate cytidylyltransferase [Plasticicumulans acidivorans]|uniref:3-deoxy-manno-octulosonate cytidylyltransferase n=1 Tax=Plasticicumulans acidivorans TaxID=886464 RepID=A0A317MS99_9GAMM|nr:3-deoxy-manno-octulosonate cytidylyltransferase [Plasticicumulans acidivorans]PWV59504.1 3-deoxy-manno-octulosonate cytidylyltransferase (CMP-KDO synthetase) [Plasticicumulans acidivorans]
MDFRVAIPARFASTRLPGKPLRLIAGRPMLEHVWQQALASGASEVVIATDDARIVDAAQSFGAEVALTRADHASGTDRLAELADIRGWADEDIIVNVQGDEPLLPPALIRETALALAAHPQAGIETLAAPLAEHELFDPNAVKLVTDAEAYALYFSRAPIPWHRDRFARGARELPPGIPYWRHIGLYAYRTSVLRRYPQLAPSPLEQAESLEQLRALWHGIRIHVLLTDVMPPAGVDTEADLARVEAILGAAG